MHLYNPCYGIWLTLWPNTPISVKLAVVHDGPKRDENKFNAESVTAIVFYESRFDEWGVDGRTPIPRSKDLQNKHDASQKNYKGK